MSIFNDEQRNALRSGIYFCDKCGAIMEWEDEETRDTLICPECGYDVDLDYYGLSEEEIDELYPTKEEVLGIAGDDDEEDEDNPYGETYDEVYGELSND